MGGVERDEWAQKDKGGCNALRLGTKGGAFGSRQAVRLVSSPHQSLYCLCSPVPGESSEPVP
jgi:hypothetical protein